MKFCLIIILSFGLIHPLKHFRDFLNNKVRLDGRKFNKYRPVGISSGSFSNCLGSSAVKLGNSNVVCGIRAELAKPNACTPTRGYIIPNVDMSFISPCMGVGPEYSDVLNCLVYKILNDSECIKLKNLCIHPKILVWVLYIDVLCLELDGGIIDAVILACASALDNLKLPKVYFEGKTDEVKVDPNFERQTYVTSILGTYSIFDRALLTDPTHNEECISNCLMHLGICKGTLMLIHKRGGVPIKKSELDSPLEMIIQRECDIVNLLDENKNGLY